MNICQRGWIAAGASLGHTIRGLEVSRKYHPIVKYIFINLYTVCSILDLSTERDPVTGGSYIF